MSSDKNEKGVIHGLEPVQKGYNDFNSTWVFNLILMLEIQKSSDFKLKNQSVIISNGQLAFKWFWC